MPETDTTKILSPPGFVTEVIDRKLPEASSVKLDEKSELEIQLSVLKALRKIANVIATEAKKVTDISGATVAVLNGEFVRAIQLRSLLLAQIGQLLDKAERITEWKQSDQVSDAFALPLNIMSGVAAVLGYLNTSTGFYGRSVSVSEIALQAALVSELQSLSIASVKWPLRIISHDRPGSEGLFGKLSALLKFKSSPNVDHQSLAAEGEALVNAVLPTEAVARTSMISALINADQLAASSPRDRLYLLQVDIVSQGGAYVAKTGLLQKLFVGGEISVGGGAAVVGSLTTFEDGEVVWADIVDHHVGYDEISEIWQKKAQ